LRTYGASSHDPFRAKICEAAKVTSAAPTFFSPIKIDLVPYGDRGAGWNNPSREALNQANVIWPNRSIRCLISLGTGEEDPVQLLEGTKLL
jgi:patatin-like phospholipase/acyl hydrolase